ncbi:MAG: ABC transporter ATP-binding protein [Prevotella sp.]|nr:ABC transporter ATP-binding protein [Prevotella sp.]
MKYILWIWRNMRGIRVNTVVRIVLGISQVSLGLLMVWLSKQFIDVTIRTGTNDDIVEMVGMLVGVVLLGILLRQAHYYMSMLANTSQSNTIRLRVFSCLFRRQMYEDQLHSGDVTSRLSKDIDTVANVTTSLLPSFVITSFQLGGAFVLLYSMDSRLALSLLLVTPVVVVFGKLFAHRLRTMTLEIRQQESVIQMHVQEGMEHNAVLRSLGSEHFVIGRLGDMQDTLIARVLRRARFTIVTRLLLGCTFSMGYLMAFVWGGLQLRAGVITFGVMTSFLQLVGQIQHPILSLLNMLPQFFYATASIDRLEELSTDKQEAPDTTETAADRRSRRTISPASQAGLRVNGVSFSYATSERPVLSAFSHDFQPGTKTAIMGETGIGKTTLFRLMLAFVKPSAGDLVLYGDGQEMPVSEATRPNFVFVPQGNTLMSGSVRYNLQLARPDATEQELRRVLHIAMADFVHDLPDGIDTLLGERGIGLSEGQAQRIAIARALLRPGGILLLDEISSSLDEATEHELFSRLFAACQDKTMIFITHRPAVSGLCDNVIRLGAA